MPEYKSSPIIVALDRMSKEEAIEIMKELGRSVWGYKLSRLANVPGIFEEIQDKAGSVNLFIDQILSGPPSAIRENIQDYLHPSVRFVSVNFTSGIKGIKAAVEAGRILKILVYSIDSSLSITDINFIFNTPFRYIQAFKAAQMVKESGAYGLHCAAHELDFLAHPDFAEIKSIPKIVVAIRPEWFEDKGVHEFVMTPREAMAKGAEKLVIGEPITKAKDKLGAVKRIMEGISSVGN